MYGVLKSYTNTGVDSELQYVFTTPLAITSNQPAYAQDAMNLKRHTSSQNVQRWEIEANIHPANDSTNFLVHSVMNGYATPIYIRMPQVYASSRVPETTQLTLSGGFQANTTTINISGTPTVYAGEFIQFVGDPKVYLVTSGGTQGVGVTISPPLRSSKVSGVSILHGNKVTMLALYDSNTQLGIQYVDGVLSDPGSVKFIESLQ